MKTLIAFLRGVNVGGKGKLPMGELKTMMESMGLRNIQTYLQSGNVVFESKGVGLDQLVDALGENIEDTFGFRPEILLLLSEQLTQAWERNPFEYSEGKHMHFFFLAEPAGEFDWDRLELLAKPSEEFHLTDAVFYLHAPEGIGRSKLAAGVEKVLGVPVTARNANTVQKVLGMT